MAPGDATVTACPACGEPAPGDVRFCEACGTELHAGGAPGGGPALAPTAHAPTDATVCPGCGAAPDAVDGYCAHCGMKQPDPFDHVELDLGRVAAVTDRGVQHHRNEDAMAAAIVPVATGESRILVVCDGVSSTADSHLAARGAAAAACDRLRADAADPVDEHALRRALVDAIADAQAAVAPIPAHGREVPSCTIVASVAIDHDDHVLVGTAWLGDSRAYLVREGTVEQISTDDSWATEQIASGVPPAEAFADPRCHSITRWLGADAPGGEPHLDVRRVARTDRLLLCSDGLWNYAPSPADLAARLASAPTELLPLAQALTRFAIEQGGHDNITVAVARLDR